MLILCESENMEVDGGTYLPGPERTRLGTVKAYKTLPYVVAHV